MSLTDLGVPDFCYVQNYGDTTHDFTYRDERTNKIVTLSVAPKTKALMPRFAVNAWFGDPDLIDHPTDPRRRSRTDELERVRIRWGIFVGEPMEGRFPDHLVVTDFEGNVLPTIHRDPYGETLAPVSAADMANQENAKLIEQMRKAIAQLEAKVLEESGEEVTITADKPADRPTQSIAVDPESPALDDIPLGPKPKPSSSRPRAVGSNDPVEGVTE